MVRPLPEKLRCRTKFGLAVIAMENPGKVRGFDISIIPGPGKLIYYIMIAELTSDKFNKRSLRLIYQ